jgi:hypothetical protein
LLHLSLVQISPPHLSFKNRKVHIILVMRDKVFNQCRLYALR